MSRNFASRTCTAEDFDSPRRPAYDLSGNTTLVAANLLFEMLCILPGVEYRR
jgi:hypothetical protein